MIADTDRATLDYRAGYWKAIVDLAGWIDQPNKAFDKKLTHPKRLPRVLFFVADHVDAFMDAPELFELYGVIEGKKMRLWLEGDGGEDR